MADIPMYRGIFFDISGVLYTGREAIPGAQSAIKSAQASDLEVRFVTNTSRRTRNQLVVDLKALGFDIDPDTLYTAPTAAHDWLERNKLRPYCLIHRDILSEFADLDQSQPNAVLIGDAAETFRYQTLDRAFQLCMGGAPLVGVGCNRYFLLDNQLHLDAGPFIKAIEYAASTEAVILGKPSKDFFEQVVASTTLEASSILMVGDDVHGDVEGALMSGLAGCLVKTGKFQPGDDKRITGAFSCVETVSEAVALALS
ncbi:MAG: TIGR01458 family HAD-type hydrolase [Motiliproteus sp.]